MIVLVPDAGALFPRPQSLRKQTVRKELCGLSLRLHPALISNRQHGDLTVKH